MSSRATEAEPAFVTHPDKARVALLRRLDRRIKTAGELSLPVAPSFLDIYIKRFALLFAAIGKKFTDEDLAALQGLVAPRLERGWQHSPHCRLIVKWESEEPPGTGVDYTVDLQYTVIAEQYEWWAANKEAPLFGVYPDARVVDEAARLGPPTEAPVLDVGAGTGRNSLPLARAGHPTDALELTEAFVTIMNEAAASEGVPLRALHGDVLGEAGAVETDKYALIVLSEVSSHFRGAADLRTFLERAATWARPGGRIVMNAFVTVDDFEPDVFARQLSQVVWSSLFTRSDIREALVGLPLRWIEDEPAYVYERAHQPPDGWPPTGWFEDWARGFDLFGVRQGLPPMELRWLVLERA